MGPFVCLINFRTRSNICQPYTESTPDWVVIFIRLKVFSVKFFLTKDCLLVFLLIKLRSNWVLGINFRKHSLMKFKTSCVRSVKKCIVYRWRMKPYEDVLRHPDQTVYKQYILYPVVSRRDLARSG